MKLLADAMLGRLARWLRALGRDVVMEPDLDDAELARRAREESRLLLTRDRRLCAEHDRPDGCRVVEARKPADQLRELAPALDLFDTGWRDRLFTRCLLCNTPLTPVAHRDVGDALPSDVRADPRVRSAGFHRCTSCGRVYWEGSHTRRMRRWLAAVSSEVTTPPGRRTAEARGSAAARRRS